MEAEAKKTIKVRLILNEDEALWLMDLMQNELYNEERQHDQEYRERFFNSIKEALDAIRH